MKTEGGIETFLFGSDSGPRAVRKNSTVMSRKESGGPGKGIFSLFKEEEILGAGEIERKEKMGEILHVDEGRELRSSSGFVNSVQHSRSSATSSHSPVSTRSLSSSSEIQDTDAVVDAEADGDTVVVQYAGSNTVEISLLPQCTDNVGNSSSNYTLLSNSGPFRESRRAVHFSESLKDGDWEDICVDVTPFTISSVEQAKGLEQVSKSMSMGESIDIKHPSEGSACEKEGEKEFRGPTPRTASANAEQVFCDAMSSSLFSPDSPLESESEKVVK